MGIEQSVDKWRLIAAIYGYRLPKTPSVKRFREVAWECGCRVWEARGRFVLGSREFQDVFDENRWAQHWPESAQEREWSVRQKQPKRERRELDAFEASGRGV